MEDINIREEIKSPTLENRPERHVRISPTKLDNETVLATALKYGTIAGVCYIVNFFIFRILGLAQIIELSLINFLILGVISFIGIRNLKLHKDGSHHMSYMQGWGTGFFISLTSFAILSLFMFVYLSYLDPAFMTYIVSRGPEGINVRPSGIMAILFFQGTALGAVVSLILMQYFRDKIGIPRSDDSMRNHPAKPYNKENMNGYTNDNIRN